MNQPLLSILIPTVCGREAQVERLLNKIMGNFTWRIGRREDNKIKWHIGYRMDFLVGFLVAKDNKDITIGEKREALYRNAGNGWSWQVDDDDDIADDAIELILEAIKQEPDCITFLENCMMNGRHYSCRHSLEYDDWKDGFGGYDFVRTPFYKDVIKTEIARSVSFEHIRYGEDHAWSRALKPHLKTEVHIPKEIYIYQHNSKPEDFSERYGFNKQ
jgi:hypothetical protein